MTARDFTIDYLGDPPAGGGVPGDPEPPGYPDFDEYQGRADRNIPVYRCEPVTSWSGWESRFGNFK